MREILVMFLALLLSACMTTEQLKSKYDRAPIFKAFALSSNGQSGASWNQPTYEQAILVAMYHCRRGGPDCRITNVNGGVFEPRPFGSPLRDSVAREYTCSNLSLTQAYSYLQQGHYYLDADGDGHPCEWRRHVLSWNPAPAATGGSNCHWVSGYTRKDGTRVRGHRRCR